MSIPGQMVALDSSALLTWVLQERGWHGVDKLLTKPGVDPVLPGPALAEVVTVARAKGNRADGERMYETFRGLGIRYEPSTAADLLRAAELLEASAANPGSVNVRSGRPATLSLADACIIAVVERLAVPVLTRYSYWSELADQGLIRVKVVGF